MNSQAFDLSYKARMADLSWVPQSLWSVSNLSAQLHAPLPSQELSLILYGRSSRFLFLIL